MNTLTEMDDIVIGSMFECCLKVSNMLSRTKILWKWASTCSCIQTLAVKPASLLTEWCALQLQKSADLTFTPLPSQRTSCVSFAPVAFNCCQSVVLPAVLEHCYW